MFTKRSILSKIKWIPLKLNRPMTALLTLANLIRRSVAIKVMKEGDYKVTVGNKRIESLFNSEFTGNYTKAFNGKWITVNLLNFKNPANGSMQQYEVVGRPPFLNSGVESYKVIPLKDRYGGVDVIATTDCPKTNEKLILLEVIYRIPVQRYVISFPAGFQDPGDKDPAETALRELKEETGYIGSNPKVSQRHWTDPWKSCDRGVNVYLSIDMKNEENLNPKTNHEFFENITPTVKTNINSQTK